MFKFNDETIIKAVKKVKKNWFPKKEKKESLIMDLINDPDLMEINIKKEADEIVIRVRKNESK